MKRNGTANLNIGRGGAQVVHAPKASNGSRAPKSTTGNDLRSGK